MDCVANRNELRFDKIMENQMQNQGPKTQSERTEWLYKNDPIFKKEKDLVDNAKKQYQKQKGETDETSNQYFKVKR